MSERHRLSIDLSESRYLKLKSHVPHGMMKIIFTILVDDICDMYDRYGEVFTAALLSNSLSYHSMVRKYIDNHETNRPKNPIRPINTRGTN